MALSEAQRETRIEEAWGKLASLVDRVGYDGSLAEHILYGTPDEYDAAVATLQGLADHLDSELNQLPTSEELWYE